MRFLVELCVCVIWVCGLVRVKKFDLVVYWGGGGEGDYFLEFGFVIYIYDCDL